MVHVDHGALDRDRCQPIGNAQEPWFITRLIFVVEQLFQFGKAMMAACRLVSDPAQIFSSIMFVPM